MKLQHVIIAFLFFISIVCSLQAQVSECKVLKPEIAASYSGDCKKGLANGKGMAHGIDSYEGKFRNGLPHGNGRYQYANGDVYDGEFKNGLKDGNGKFTYKYLGKDSTYLGIWQEDKFVKKILPAAYTILQNLNVQRYSVQRIGDGNRIMFAFMQNGMYNRSVSGLSFAESGGVSLTLGQEQGFDNIRFPFTCKVIYTSSNSLRTSTYDIIFEIRINEPGQWLVTLNN
jgi:hypothetical protein